MHVYVKGEEYLFLGPSAISSTEIDWSLAVKSSYNIRDMYHWAKTECSYKASLYTGRQILFALPNSEKDYYREEAKQHKMGRKCCV